MMKTTLLLSIAVLAMPALAGTGAPPPVTPTPTPTPTVPAKKKTAKQVVFTKLFNQADTDGNQILDFEEFSKSHGANKRPAITEVRFDKLATLIELPPVEEIPPAEDEPVPTISAVIVAPARGILLDAFIEARGGRAIKPTQAEIFAAADDNLDGALDLDEFAATRAFPPSNAATIFKAFDRIDKNDDALITRAEFGLKVIVD